MQLNDDDIERIRDEVDPINFVDALRRVRFLMSKAVPNNWATRELINRWGFDPDYSEGDEGMSEHDND